MCIPNINYKDFCIYLIINNVYLHYNAYLECKFKIYPNIIFFIFKIPINSKVLIISFIPRECIHLMSNESQDSDRMQRLMRD